MWLEFFISGAWLPLVWIYLPTLGFSGRQIALCGSAFPVSALIAIFAGNHFADRHFSAERFMAASHLVGGLALLGLYFTRDFRLFFALLLLHAICYVPTISIINSLAFTHLEDAQADFGRVRIGGTLGWMLASWPLYLVLRGATADGLPQALGHMFLIAGVASLVLAGVCLTLPRTPPTPAGAAREKLAWREALQVLGRSRILQVLCLVAWIESILHYGYSLLAGSFLQRAGIRSENIMPIMSLGQWAEIITMAGLGFMLRRLGWRRTMACGILGEAARYFLIAASNNHPVAIIAVQFLHGVCTAFFFAALCLFVDSAFPSGIRTSAQGLFNLVVLGLGDLTAKWLFMPLHSRLVHDGLIDYRLLLFLPVCVAVGAGVILLAGCRLPDEIPAKTAVARVDAAPG